MSPLRKFAALVLAAVLMVGPGIAAVGSWNGVAFTGWNGVAQTGWNGTTISCASGVYTAHSANSDGTAYLSRGDGLDGAADSVGGLISFWYDPAGTDGVQQTIFQSNNVRVSIIKDSSNILRVYMTDDSDNYKVRIQSNSTIVAATGRIHIIASWNTSNNRAQLYINDASDANIITQSNDNVKVDYTDSNWGIFWGPGGYPSTVGSIGEFYFNCANALDFDLSVTGNRRKFITAGLAPVNLGSDGSTPTGTAPIVYQKSAYTSYETNSGSGGNFTKTGSFTDGGDFP